MFHVSNKTTEMCSWMWNSFSNSNLFKTSNSREIKMKENFFIKKKVIFFKKNIQNSLTQNSYYILEIHLQINDIFTSF